MRLTLYQTILFLLPLTCLCQEKKSPNPIEDSLKVELIRTTSILQYEKVQAERLAYLLTAKEMALRSMGLKDSIFEALVAIQAYNFNKNYKGKSFDIDVYSALLKALERFNDPMLKTLTVKTDKEISGNTEAIVSNLCSRIKRNMTIDEWNIFSSHLPYEKTCAISK